MNEYVCTIKLDYEWTSRRVYFDPYHNKVFIINETLFSTQNIIIGDADSKKDAKPVAEEWVKKKNQKREGL